LVQLLPTPQLQVRVPLAAVGEQVAKQVLHPTFLEVLISHLSTALGFVVTFPILLQ
jgi:hypothetical protein